MRRGNLLRIFLAVLMFGLPSIGLSVRKTLKPPAEAPKKITIYAKVGIVTFDHVKHVQREKGKCVVCHDKVFPQSNAPLNYAAESHKLAEAKKTSCAFCHVSGGKAFESKGNCTKCHAKT